MDQPAGLERPIPEIWFEPNDRRRLSAVARRSIIAPAVVALALAAALVTAFVDRVATNEEFEGQVLAAALASAAPEERAELSAAAGRDALFGLQLDLDAEQTACFTDQITVSAARDLLRLVLFGDQDRFSGTGGEVLLALCSR